MAVKIKIHPFRAAAPLGATEDAAVKRAGLLQISDGKSEMKGLHTSTPWTLDPNKGRASDPGCYFARALK
jgi:hypothetical protein